MDSLNVQREKIREPRRRAMAAACGADVGEAFKKESGSFTYGVNTSTPQSQGMPVAIVGSCEGDIDGHVLTSSGLLQHIYSGLDLVEYKVPPFTRCDFYRYMNILAEKIKELNLI